MQPVREPPGSARLPRELLVEAVAACTAKQASPDVSAQLVEGITFRKAEHGKVVCTSFCHHYCQYPSNAKSNHDHAQAQQLICTVCLSVALPSFVGDDWGGDHWFLSNRTE